MRRRACLWAASLCPVVVILVLSHLDLLDYGNSVPGWPSGLGTTTAVTAERGCAADLSVYHLRRCDYNLRRAGLPPLAARP